MTTSNLTGYCLYCKDLPEENANKHYHDNVYGFPVQDDNELFARLVLEINQAGLSWNTILLKKDNFYRAFDQFQIEKVAQYKEEDLVRLLSDAGIIRNRLKIHAAIYNAQEIIALKKEFGSFYEFLSHHHPKTKDEWVKIFKKRFKFVGGEIVNEFLMSTGFLKGAHCKVCKVYAQIEKMNPKWLNE